jgi:hypothetical protein
MGSAGQLHTWFSKVQNAKKESRYHSSILAETWIASVPASSAKSRVYFDLRVTGEMA